MQQQCIMCGRQFVAMAPEDSLCSPDCMERVEAVRDAVLAAPTAAEAADAWDWARFGAIAHAAQSR